MKPYAITAKRGFESDAPLVEYMELDLDRVTAWVKCGVVERCDYIICSGWHAILDTGASLAFPMVPLTVIERVRFYWARH